MIPALRYAWLTTVHRWFVLVAGLRVRVPIYQLLVHDLSKYSSTEIFAYGRQFFGDKANPKGFARAWLHHQNANPHHWEYWLTRSGQGVQKAFPYIPLALPMPERYMREMVADWMAASRAYTGSWDILEWFKTNEPKMHLEDGTRYRVRELVYVAMGGLSDRELGISPQEPT